MVIKLELNPMDTNFVFMVKVIVTEEAWRYSDEFKAIAVEETRKCLNRLRSKATMTSRRMEIKSEGESFDLNVNSMVREMLTYEMPVLLDVLHGMKVEEMQRRFRQLLQSSAQNVITLKSSTQKGPTAAVAHTSGERVQLDIRSFLREVVALQMSSFKDQFRAAVPEMLLRRFNRP